VERVGTHRGLTAAEVRRKRLAPSIVKSRRLVDAAVRKLDYQTSEIAELLHMTSDRVSMAARRGAKAADQKLMEQLFEG
jgi:hypothetical protein